VYGTNVGGLSSSTDAITWTARTSQTTSNINALTFGTIFVYGADGGGLATSTDGTTWTARTSGTSSAISALTYGSSLYIYGGAASSAIPAFATSTDAITWSVQNSTTTAALSSLGSSSTLFLAGGGSGTLETSNTGYAYNSATSFQVPTDNSIGQLISGTVGFNAGITVELPTNFKRSLYIKAL
jgi:hypothetical protein